MISFCLLASVRALYSSRADVVVLLTNPPFFSAIGSLLKRFRGERFVYVLMDIYPDVAIRGGVLREGSLAERVLRRLARFTLKEADVVVVLGENMKEAALHSGAIPSRVKVIPNWADPDRIFPVPAVGNRLRRSLGLDGKFVVEYSGNMGVSHSFGDLLAVIEEMQVFEDIRFVFIGGGERRPEIDAFVRTKRLENVVLLPYQDDTALPQSLSMGDVHYVSLREGFEGLVFPSKVYGIMAAGRPLIYQGTGGDDVARMVVEGGMGIVVRPGDKDGLREAIFALYRDREGRLRMGENGRRALVEKYSAAKGLDSYRNVLEGKN
jgi:glycosyltransferase involved in cell wall biosynthesis